jgi:hypothetical protein
VFRTHTAVHAIVLVPVIAWALTIALATVGRQASLAVLPTITRKEWRKGASQNHWLQHVGPPLLHRYRGAVFCALSGFRDGIDFPGQVSGPVRRVGRLGYGPSIGGWAHLKAEGSRLGE